MVNNEEKQKSIHEDYFGPSVEYESEIMNLLYVAITRAKQELVLIYQTDTKEEWMQNLMINSVENNKSN